jgi:hypothetical protein
MSAFASRDGQADGRDPESSLAVAIGDTELLEAPVLEGLLIVISLSEGEGIIYIDAEIPNGALDLCMAERHLDGAQVARLLVDDGRLSSAQRMRPIICSSWYLI